MAFGLFKKKKSLKEINAQLRLERDRFVAFAFASADILIEVDSTGLMTYVDGAISKMVGGKNGPPKNGQPLMSLFADNEKKTIRDLLFERGGVTRIDNIKVHINGKNDKPMPFMMSGFKLPDLDDHYFITFSLIKGEANDLTKRDPRTGMLKKEAFSKSAGKQVMDAQQRGQDVSMTLVDFPEFAEFLDNLEPTRARELMGKITNYLGSRSMADDAAGIIREGTYGFLHDSGTSMQQVASELAELTKEADPEGTGTKVRSRTLKMDAKGLTEQDAANALLYTINKFAQDSGDGFNLTSLGESYQTMVDETVKKISAFKNTIHNDKFEVAFQPIVDLKTTRIHHYEGLVRFDDRETFENPFEFISFGEQAGIIGEFDLAMIQKVLDMLQERAGKNRQPVVSINLSGRSLTSSLFKDALRKMLKANKDISSQVVFEITESYKIEDLDAANKFIQELRRNGNAVCLDDFGSGESSFEYLKKLHIDFVKIDGSYVKESLGTKRGRHLLRAISALCNDLNISTIAEMIENENVARFLADAGITLGQGFYFGKPDPSVQKLHSCTQLSPMINQTFRARKFKQAQRRWWSRH